MESPVPAGQQNSSPRQNRGGKRSIVEDMLARKFDHTIKTADLLGAGLVGGFWDSKFKTEELRELEKELAKISEIKLSRARASKHEIIGKLVAERDQILEALMQSEVDPYSTSTHSRDFSAEEQMSSPSNSSAGAVSSRSDETFIEMMKNAIRIVMDEREKSKNDETISISRNDELRRLRDTIIAKNKIIEELKASDERSSYYDCIERKFHRLQEYVGGILLNRRLSTRDILKIQELDGTEKLLSSLTDDELIDARRAFNSTFLSGLDDSQTELEDMILMREEYFKQHPRQ